MQSKEMNLEVIIYSHNQSAINDWLEVFILDGFNDSKKLKEHFNIRFKCANVTDILKENEFDAVVSAANSMVDMSGGSDRAIAEWYHSAHKVNIQGNALDSAIEFGQTALGRPAIPIGCCALVTPTSGPKMIVAPTMTLPEDVSGTKNATLAMYSVVRFLYWYNKHAIGDRISRILVPCLCTGYGEMPAAEAAMQTFTAMARVLNPKFKKKVKGEKFTKEGYHAPGVPETKSDTSLKKFSEFLRMAELASQSESSESE